MFSWLFNTNTNTKKVSFEDIQRIIKDKKYLLINTLSDKEQNCLIKGTTPINKEVEIVNHCLNKTEISIIVYGKNTNDISIIKKYNQLAQLGFSKVYVYLGGLFEWLCLQDIYGKTSFPTMGEELDILKYRALPEINKNYYIENKI